MLCAVRPSIYLEVEKFSLLFRTAIPFPHVVIDNFLNESVAEKLVEEFPRISSMHRCHHYLFANKYELSSWSSLSNSFYILHQELLSNQFSSFICKISGESLFIDAEVYGDLQQANNGGFLDMHADSNLHPIRENWIHRLNLMIYLNKNWRQEYGGHLQLKSNLEEIGKKFAPVFNRCVIMLSSDTTYHGYTRLNIPNDMTRKSIVIHFYKQEALNKVPFRKMTTWMPEKQLKRSFAKLYNPLASLKKRWWG
ncbi:MAG: 2OG-Fe(II) oxygenase [Chroococcidiopsidaceae cyanobacterium CP_BM_ER_R8_30]|nr:2OG-Fe(II) oxygenase [Chroococcidiopsidaceae cyanobacterium CP_BM_ER_R8_30]